MNRTLQAAGLNSSFKSHSTRSASISKAVILGMEQRKVQTHARISSEQIFKKHYLRITSGAAAPPNIDLTGPMSHILRSTFNIPNN